MPFTAESRVFQHPPDPPNSLLCLPGYPSTSRPELDLIPAAPLPHKIPENQKKPQSIDPSASPLRFNDFPSSTPSPFGFFCFAEIQRNVGFSFPGAGGGSCRRSGFHPCGAGWWEGDLGFGMLEPAVFPLPLRSSAPKLQGSH